MDSFFASTSRVSSQKIFPELSIILHLPAIRDIMITPGHLYLNSDLHQFEKNSISAPQNTRNHHQKNKILDITLSDTDTKFTHIDTQITDFNNKFDYIKYLNKKFYDLMEFINDNHIKIGNKTPQNLTLR